MPSTTIQSRISAFEALTGPSSSSSRPTTTSASSSPHNQQDASDILESPLSPITPASLQPVTLFTKPSPSPSPPNLGRKTSLIDLKDWVIDEGPSHTQQNGLIDSSKTPTQPAFKTQLHAASVNPKFHGTPLISLESPPKPRPKPKPANISINMKQGAPPQLPPRKSSYTSLKSVASSSSAAPPSRRTDSLTVEHAYPPASLDANSRSGQSTTHVPSSSISSFHSVSLSSDTDPSTPGSVANFISTFPVDMDHNVNRRNGDTDSVSSLTESFEEVTASSFASPTTVRLMNLEWQNAPSRRSQVPPKLPERPNSARTSMRSTPPSSNPVSRTNSGSIPNSPVSRPALSTSTSSTMIPTPYVPRRSAPPPPSRSSDRSSIRSNATTQSFSSGSQTHLPPSIPSLNKRPTPVPLGVRKRYEALFNANVLQGRRAEKQKSEDKPALLSPGEAKGRRAVGWRGLSVDLITGDNIAVTQQQSQLQQNGDKLDLLVGSEDTLDGAIVKVIWRKSGVGKERLSEIWNECDPAGQGVLTVDAFAKGMWRIDEELRRAQAQSIRSATSSSGMYRAMAGNRPVPKLPSKPRDILR